MASGAEYDRRIFGVEVMSIINYALKIILRFWLAILIIIAIGLFASYVRADGFDYRDKRGVRHWNHYGHTKHFRHKHYVRHRKHKQHILVIQDEYKFVPLPPEPEPPQQWPRRSNVPWAGDLADPFDGIK